MTDAAGAVRVAPDPLREPWSELARQREAATFGMWLFLMSEMLFFGALFMAFSFSRAFSPAAFMEGARHTEIAYGAANTVVLVTSSLTVTLAVRAADIGRARPRGDLSRGDGDARASLSCHQGLRISRRPATSSLPGRGLRARPERRASLLGLLLGDDWHPCDPSRDRNRACAPAILARAPVAGSARRPRNSRSRRSTGIWSTPSGSFCFRFSMWRRADEQNLRPARPSMAWAARRVDSDTLRRRSGDLARNRAPKPASVDCGSGAGRRHAPRACFRPGWRRTQSGAP